MTYAIQDKAIRDVAPVDAAIADLVAAVTGAGPVAVHPDRQNRGVGNALLERHEACRPVSRLPDGPPPWSMWRVPMRP